MTTEAVYGSDQFDAWRDAVCTMIHRVQVKARTTTRFHARLAGHRHAAAISCASFCSEPHEVISGGEQAGTAGSAGYLVSWQLEGEARVEQKGLHVVQRPGEVAIVDARLPLQVAFPGNVKRLVAKMPADVLEQRIPRLSRSRAIAFRPQGPLSSLLFAHLNELAGFSIALRSGEAQLMAENICNLLRMTVGDSQPVSLETKALRRDAIQEMLLRHAGDPDFSLESLANGLNMSKRSVQKAFQEMETHFTERLTDERIRRAKRLLLDMPHAQISDLAYRSGFTDVSNFNHQFKRREKMSPSEWRVCHLDDGRARD